MQLAFPPVVSGRVARPASGKAGLMFSLPLLALLPLLRWLFLVLAGTAGRLAMASALLVLVHGVVLAGSPPVSLATRLEYARLAVPRTGATTTELAEPIHLAVDLKVGEVEVSDYAPLTVVFVPASPGRFGPPWERGPTPRLGYRGADRNQFCPHGVVCHPWRPFLDHPGRGHRNRHLACLLDSGSF